jgi:TP901 family phage tail tape measure protein
VARALSVSIKADVSAYSRAMKRAGAETDNFTRKMSHVGRAGMSMSRLGDTMTRSVTLPILAVGAAAVKMALDFDNSFTKMQTLAGVTGDEVDGLKESVLGLAGETGQSPRELAEALYFLRSSGLDGAAALDALEVSAKGSAAGLGPVAVVADGVSSAMLAYAESGLTAAAATDVLVATAREGKVEPAELAGQMGRLVPIAAELGISFDEVGASIAVMSQRGNNAEQATTKFQAVMVKLLKPSAQARELLDGVGLSAEKLRQMVGEDLLGALIELRERLGQSGFEKFLEETNAIQGGLSLLGGDLNKTKDVFGELANSAGATEKAFEIWGKSLGAQTSRAITEFQVALIGIGQVLLPIAADVATFAAGIVNAFSGLPSGAKTAIIYFGLVLAAVGPLLSIGGRLMTTMAMVSSNLSLLATSAGPLAPAFNAAAAATGRFSLALGTLTKATFVVGALFALREVLGTIDDEIDKTSLSELENQLLSLGQSGEVTGETLKRVFAGLGEGGAPFDARQLSSDLNLLDEALAKLAARDPDAAAAAFEKIKDALEGQGASVAQVEAAFDGYGAALSEADTASRTAEGGLGDAEAAMAELGLETEETTTALQAFADAVKAQFDPLFAMIDAQQQSVEAQRELREAEEELTKARDSGDQDKITAAEDRLREARISGAKSIVDQQVAANQLKDALDAGIVSADDAARQIVEMGVAQGWTKGQTMAMAAELGVATEVANELGRTDPTVDVSETGGARTRGTLTSVQQAAINAGRQRPNVQVRATDRASGVLGFIRGRINQLPSSKTINVTTVYRESFLGRSTVGRALARQHGGPVKAGQAYVVGEHRPELFVPDRDGMILPQVPGEGVGAPWAGAGGGAVVVNNYVTIDRPVVASEAEFARMVARGLSKAGELGMPVTLRGRSL